MTTGMFIGRFQPFHIEHLYKVLDLVNRYNPSKIIIVPVYYERKGKEYLSPKNPIPINYRIRYISEALSRYIPQDKYFIYPLKIGKNILRDFISLLKMIGDREYIIITGDISRYFLFYILKLLLILRFNIRIVYHNKHSISASEIREAIINGKYEDIRKLLPKDLDEEIIQYLKVINNMDKGRDLDSVLRIFF